ncbi:MAG: GNAT family N-acetyltransferase [Planctomycetia bacterium]|nr:GNAT family N-acetyltransferase [Planctomycetia bacterium]
MEIRRIHKKELPAAVDLFKASASLPLCFAADGGRFNRDIGLTFVAVDGKTVLGVCFCIPMYGNVVTALAPKLAEGQATDLAVQLLSHALAEIQNRRGPTLVQTLLPAAAEEDDAAILTGAGMRRLATLVYMARPTAPEDAEIDLDRRLSWLGFSRKNRAMFIDVIQQTYAGSLDCQGLEGVRRIEDILETHKHTGRFTPDGWHVACVGPQAVGCILMNQRRIENKAELVYMGVVPGHRGTGIGRELVMHAMVDARRLGTRSLELAVDEANQPAMRIYAALAFVETGRAEAFIMPPQGC